MLSRAFIVIVSATVIITSLSLGVVLLPDDPSLAWVLLVMTPFTAIAIIMFLVGLMAFLGTDREEEVDIPPDTSNVHDMENYR